MKKINKKKIVKRGWQQKSSKTVYRNKYFKVHHDKVIQPDGNEGDYFPIITGGSVMVVVEDVEDKLVLVGQSRYTLNNMYSWEFVGGGMESEKNPLQVARKELKEETGIEGDSWTELGYFYPLNGISTEKCFVFLVRDLKFGQANNEATEDISLRKVTIPEIQQMININEISCGMTIATFYKYLIYK
jgi:8-oxo-dGTP pyrophosphatase MutT (NUDIX family)